MRRSRAAVAVRALAAASGLAAAGVLTGAVPAAAAGGAAVGRPAPDFRLAGLDGIAFGRDRFRGRAVYINVFASWCPPCRGEIPTIVAAHATYGKRIAFLGVDAQEPPGVARRFAAAMHVSYAVGIDRGQMAVTYGASSLPESIFIDRHGVVRAIVHGTVDAATLDRDLARIAVP